MGAGIQIPANSSRILHGLGVLARVRELSVILQRLVIRSYRGSELYTQPLGWGIEKKFQYPHLLIHRADIARILYDEARVRGADVHFNSCIKTLNPTTGTVEIEGGKCYSADLIVGAKFPRSVLPATKG